MRELNESNFKDEIKNMKLALVDFYATWCGPCGMQAKVLDKIQNSRNIGFDIVKINVDESPRLAFEYGIESIPTLMIFKGNTLVRKVVGYMSEDEILKMMEDI